MNAQEKNKLGYIDKAILWAVHVAGVLFILAGIGLFGFQVFAYLKHGEWVEFPLSILILFGPEKFVSWLNNPTSWLGLHKIIDSALGFIPLSLFVIVVGVVMAGYEAEIDSA